MNSKERVLKTLALGMPDRLPTAFHNSAVVAEISGLSYAEFFRSGEAMAASHIQARERFGYDAIIVDSGTHCSAETLGCGAFYDDKKYPVTTHPALASLEKVRQLRMPDPENTFPASEMIACIRRLRQYFDDEVAIIATGDQGPFTLSALLLGLEAWLIAIIENQQSAWLHEVLNFATAYTTRYALALFKAGAHVVRFGDSFGGTQVVSPQVYSLWTYPYEKKLMEALKPYGFPTSIHICGDATPILAEMVDTGASMVEVDERSDFTKTCAACAGKVALLGPVSPANMVFKSFAEVKAEARLAVEIARAAGTALILGAGCSMAGDTPHESIDAVVEAASTFGVYR